SAAVHQPLSPQAAHIQYRLEDADLLSGRIAGPLPGTARGRLARDGPAGRRQRQAARRDRRAALLGHPDLTPGADPDVLHHAGTGSRDRGREDSPDLLRPGAWRPGDIGEMK